MTREGFPGGPNIFDPVKPSAVGSRNSINQETRSQDTEAKQIIDEEVDKILNHMNSKLPPEVLQNLEVMGSVKDKLYNYVNLNYVNMMNRYITTAEDEMMKKVRDFVDKEEFRGLAKYTPTEITILLDKLGGMEHFNTGEVEKSVINMYGHLQGHVQRGVNDFENITNSLLKQKTDVGEFIQGENAYTILKCSFKDNLRKPKVVTDVKLSINILDSELISPIFQYQVTADYLIRDVIAKHITDLIDKEIEDVKDRMVNEGDAEMTDSEELFERIKRVEKYTSDELEEEDSARYKYVAKHLMDKISGLRADIPMTEFDSLNVRECIKKTLDSDNIRNRGFNTAINSLTAILDNSKMGYQYAENLKNARSLVIREYEDSKQEKLPDERYQIALKYIDFDELVLDREAYDKQMLEFQKEIDQLCDVVNAVYQGRKKYKTINDFDDLHDKVKSDIKKYKKTKNPDYDEDETSLSKEWNEIAFVKPEESEVERANRTYEYDHNYQKNRFLSLKKKLKKMYLNQNPVERVILEKRIDFLQKKYEEYAYILNPYHIQPGLVLDIDIVSIKKKKITLTRMANVINEFLSGISKGFEDNAFSAFSQRRATLRDDISRSFSKN